MKHRTHFRRTHLMPLVQGGIVTMTNPDNPRAVNQGDGWMMPRANARVE